MLKHMLTSAVPPPQHRIGVASTMERHLRTPSNTLSEEFEDPALPSLARGDRLRLTQPSRTAPGSPYAFHNGYILTPAAPARPTSPGGMHGSGRYRNLSAGHSIGGHAHLNGHVPSMVLNTSKHSLGNNTSTSTSPATTTSQTKTTGLDQSSQERSHLMATPPGPGGMGRGVANGDLPHRQLSGSSSSATNTILASNPVMANGGFQHLGSRNNTRATSPTLGAAASSGGTCMGATGAPALLQSSSQAQSCVSRWVSMTEKAGLREMLSSLGLLSLLSLLLALLALIFLLRMAPLKDYEWTTTATPEFNLDYTLVYEVTLALCSLTLSLNVCCLLVCAVQFIFAVKLLRIPHGKDRIAKFLKDSSITRMCAVAGFFLSIPVFLTDIVLYTMIQHASTPTPTIVSAVVIGLAIIFCGIAMIHNVYVWQREKTRAGRTAKLQQAALLNTPAKGPAPSALDSSPSGIAATMPLATLDLSLMSHNQTQPLQPSLHELSTLV